MPPSKKTKKNPKKQPAPTTGPASELIITISGPEQTVRRTLTAMRFEGEWNHVVTRQIAIDQTLAPDAGLDDTLAGDKVRFFSQDARDLYVQRCVNEASRHGHPVGDPSSIPADADTTVMEVGDALFDNSRH